VFVLISANYRKDIDIVSYDRLECMEPECELVFILRSLVFLPMQGREQTPSTRCMIDDPESFFIRTP
jgi:hypothetical protein